MQSDPAATIVCKVGRAHNRAALNATKYCVTLCGSTEVTTNQRLTCDVLMVLMSAGFFITHFSLVLMNPLLDFKKFVWRFLVQRLSLDFQDQSLMFDMKN